MSSSALSLETEQWEIGLSPVADFAGADPVYSDIVNMKRFNRAQFIVQWGVGTTGTIKFTVEASDDVSASNVTAVPFAYRVNNAGTHGAATVTTAATGFTNTAGSDQILVVEVDAEDMIAAGYTYLRLKMDEVTNSPILGGIAIRLFEPRNSATTPATALT
jgi:hypothetical protein